MAVFALSIASRTKTGHGHGKGEGDTCGGRGQGPDQLPQSHAVAEPSDHENERGEAHEHENESAANGDHNEGADPHTWTAPSNVIVWVRNIEHALQDLDPTGAEVYSTNAEVYEEQLKTLDAWVREQVAQIPEADRQIVTDHQIFAYFADEYGFNQVGAVVPAHSTAAEPTAKELAELEDAIKERFPVNQ